MLAKNITQTMRWPLNLLRFITFIGEKVSLFSKARNASVWYQPKSKSTALYFFQMSRFFLLFLFWSCVGYAKAQDEKWPCPSVKVLGPRGVFKPGDTVSFEARIEPNIHPVRFRWDVIDGNVEDGGGTFKILVRVANDIPYQVVTAVLLVEGLARGCNPMGAASLPITGQLLEGCPADEFGSLKPNDVKGRLDNFFQELTNNSNNQGFVVLRTPENERIGIHNTRFQLILRHAKFRKFDLRRIDFAFAPSHDSAYVFWRVPPGARIPDCDRCFIVKGVEVK
jgi:hypothetical protein